jgi:hypothetical protein
MKQENSGLKFVVGESYFKIEYFDKQRNVPDIETVVYLGTHVKLTGNSSGEGKYLYFQDAHSYFDKGPLTSLPKSDDDAMIYEAERRDAVLAMLDRRELIETLSENNSWLIRT